MYVCIIVNVVTGDDHPTLRDMYIVVVPRCAVKWRDLGLALGVESFHLDLIHVDHPNSCEHSCRLVLMRWLETDPSATWSKLIDAIEVISHATSKLEGNGHMYMYCMISRL